MGMFGRKLVPMDEEGKQQAQIGPIVEKGDLVKDKITGFTGVVVCVLDYLHGCTRLAVQSSTMKDGLPTEPQYFDSYQVEIVTKGFYFQEKKKIEKPTGGEQYLNDNRPVLEQRINQRR